jgi:acyl carrier protein
MKEALNLAPGADIGLDTVLDGHDGWDSLGKFLLLSSVYSSYGVTLEPEILNASRTIGELWAAVQDAAGGS